LSQQGLQPTIYRTQGENTESKDNLLKKFQQLFITYLLIFILDFSSIYFFSVHYNVTFVYLVLVIKATFVYLVIKVTFVYLVIKVTFVYLVIKVTFVYLVIKVTFVYLVIKATFVYLVIKVTFVCFGIIEINFNCVVNLVPFCLSSFICTSWCWSTDLLFKREIKMDLMIVINTKCFVDMKEKIEKFINCCLKSSDRYFRKRTSSIIHEKGYEA
jgi:hypothetical protein